MLNTGLYFQRYTSIMDDLHKENICSSLSIPNFNQKLSLIREYALSIAHKENYIAPGLTSCVAATLLKVGLCQELSNRFVLEYCIRFKEKNISIIHLGSFDDPINNNHILVQIGPIVAPECLILGKGPPGTFSLKPQQYNQNLIEYLSSNANGFFVDPLLKCQGVTKEKLNPLIEYCRKNNITHVIGVRPFFNTPLLIENADKIMQNAIELSKKVQKKLSQTNQNVYLIPQNNVLLFNNKEFNPLIKKYKLPDQTQLSLEKALRNAATNNQIEDIIKLIEIVKNINAQDSNPKIKRTALHWAAIKGHEKCCELLMGAGADPNILDASGNKAYNLNSSPKQTNPILSS